MTFGSEGAMAMSPIESAEASRSNVVVQVTPLFTLLKTPPEAVPTNIVDGLPGTASMSSMRPPDDAGPMCRHVMWSRASGRKESAVGCARTPTADSRRKEQKTSRGMSGSPYTALLQDRQPRRSTQSSRTTQRKRALFCEFCGFRVGCRAVNALSTVDRDGTSDHQHVRTFKRFLDLRRRSMLENVTI